MFRLSPILLHKPAGYSVQAAGKLNALDLLTPRNWHQGDTPAPIRMLQKHFQNLECLEPLPVPASGLTVLTQDRRVAPQADGRCAVYRAGVHRPCARQSGCGGAGVPVQRHGHRGQAPAAHQGELAKR